MRKVRGCWLMVAALLICLADRAYGQGTVEIGSLDGAEYRIDVPENWNHSLVVYYHGYSEKPIHYLKDHGPQAGTKSFLIRGYAVIQSGYSTTGWAVKNAYADTELLRQSFVEQHGRPTETFVSGFSEGGALTMITLEKNPSAYTGALDLCGAVVPTNEWAQRRFAMLAAFEFYFPGLLPNLVPAPVDYVETEATHQALLTALKADPADAARMKTLTSLYTDEHVAHLMQYIVYQISDFSRKAGGNVVDTQNFLYTGAGSPEEDFRLNDGVKRYTADPEAREWMLGNYSGTGKVLKPMLAVHTIYDNLIPAGTLEIYAERVAEQGYSDHFVLQYVDHIGHCAISDDEVGTAFDELLGWVHGGTKPSGGKLPVKPLTPAGSTARVADTSLGG